MTKRLNWTEYFLVTYKFTYVDTFLTHTFQWGYIVITFFIIQLDYFDKVYIPPWDPLTY